MWVLLRPGSGRVPGLSNTVTESRVRCGVQPHSTFKTHTLSRRFAGWEEEKEEQEYRGGEGRGEVGRGEVGWVPDYSDTYGNGGVY